MRWCSRVSGRIASTSDSLRRSYRSLTATIPSSTSGPSTIPKIAPPERIDTIRDALTIRSTARPPPIAVPMRLGQPERERRPVFAPADDQGLTVEERPDAAVLAEEEADPAELAGGESDERAAVDEVEVDRRPGHRARVEMIGTVRLQFGAGPTVLVDDQHGPLPVEQQWAALRVAQAGRVRHRQSGLVGDARR